MSVADLIMGATSFWSWFICQCFVCLAVFLQSENAKKGLSNAVKLLWNLPS